MNHDGTHCLDYKSSCPKSCYEDGLQKTCEKGSIHCQLPGHIAKEAQSVQLPESEMVISGMYESPIEIYHRRMSQKIEDDIIKAVQELCVEVDISVDKEELIKALQYDRDQYAKGYKDGMNLRYGDDVAPRAEVARIFEEIEQHIKDVGFSSFAERFEFADFIAELKKKYTED